MQLVRTALLTSLIMILGEVAHAEWSANIGWASDYFFRGIHQKQSSANAGVDFEKNGFYAGTWLADVGENTGDGLEIDGYFGYGTEIGGVSLSAGFTGYYYTGDFDDTYQEVNLSSSFGIATLDVAIGEYQNFDGPNQDYIWYSLTLEKNGFYGRYGAFDNDFVGDYWELGYATTVAEIDLGLYALFSSEELVFSDSSEALVFTIDKSFDIR